MDTIKLSDINLLDVGHTIQLVGGVYSGPDAEYLCYFPAEPSDPDKPIKLIDMETPDWEKFIRQSDLLETEILARAKDGKLTKIIARKTTRQIDQAVSWKVYRRDNYTCRYCNRTGVPLTVDHLVLWEEGGPSIEANLLSSCKKCNRMRGNKQYADWLQDPYYLKVSKNLPQDVRDDNQDILPTLTDIPRQVHRRSR